MRTELLLQTASEPSAAHRQARPALDLLNRIADEPASRIGVLYAGPWPMEALLVQRFPNADIAPLDPHSLRSGSRARTDFDLVVSSGDVDIPPSLRQALPGLAARLRPGGRLAVQTPDDLYEPYRVLIRMVAADGPWARTLLPIAKTRPFNESMEDLYALLRPVCASIDIWETTYLRAMDGIEAIVDVMKATSLAPFLNPLGKGAREAFLDRYAAELSKAYPALAEGSALVRFPRIFVLARARPRD